MACLNLSEMRIRTAPIRPAHPFTLIFSELNLGRGSMSTQQRQHIWASDAVFLRSSSSRIDYSVDVSMV